MLLLANHSGQETYLAKVNSDRFCGVFGKPASRRGRMWLCDFPPLAEGSVQKLGHKSKVIGGQYVGFVHNATCREYPQYNWPLDD